MHLVFGVGRKRTLGQLLSSRVPIPTSSLCQTAARNTISPSFTSNTNTVKNEPRGQEKYGKWI